MIFLRPAASRTARTTSRSTVTTRSRRSRTPGERRYVLVVTTGAIKSDSAAYQLVADLSRLVYEAGRK